MKIIFHSEGTWGDILPFAFLASELKSRGHEITIATNEYYRELIESRGINYITTTDISFRDNFVSNPDLWKPIRGFFFLAKANEQAFFATYDALAPKIEHYDLVIGGIPSAAPKVLAQEAKIPYIGVALTPMYTRSNTHLPILPNSLDLNFFPSFLVRLFYPVLDMFADRIYGKHINHFLRQNKIKPIKSFLHFGTIAKLTVGLWPAWYAPPHIDQTNLRTTNFPRNVELTSELQPMLKYWLAKGELPFVFTLGTSHHFSDQLASSLREISRELGVRCVLIDAKANESFSEHLAHIKSTSLSQLLPLSQAIFHHGGAGTIAQAVNAGVPQIISPMAVDQADNAHYVAFHNLGTTFNSDTDLDSIRKILKEFDPTKYKIQCDQVRKKVISQKDGLAWAADVILENVTKINNQK